MSTYDLADRAAMPGPTDRELERRLANEAKVWDAVFETLLNRPAPRREEYTVPYGPLTLVVTLEDEAVLQVDAYSHESLRADYLIADDCFEHFPPDARSDIRLAAFAKRCERKDGAR